MDLQQLKRAAATTLMVLAIALGGTALLLLSQTAQNSRRFGQLHDVILVVNAVAVIVLLILLAGNLWRLLRDRRHGVPGSRLKTRMVLAFAGLAMAPILIVFAFAVQFVNRGIETWFDVDVEEGLRAALVLSRSALDVRMRAHLRQVQDVAPALRGLDDAALVREVGRLRRESGALEMTVLGDNYRIIATSAEDPAQRLPDLPPDEVQLMLRQNGTYVGLEPGENGSLRVRAGVMLKPRRPGEERLALQALYSLGPRVASLADSVQQSYTRYGELLFLREPLKNSFTLTLTLVVMLSVLAAIYGAFFFARRLTAPIQSLVAGTRAVAEGDLDTRLPVSSRDEIGVLVASFNEMIQRLAQAREDTRISEQQVENERASLEAVLARLSTGVIALEADGRIRVANEAAGAILGIRMESFVGRHFGELADANALGGQLLSAFDEHVAADEREWREQLTLRTDTGRLVLICACTGLPGEAGAPGGCVLVFDDVTALMQAQRDAAWGEVARRLAHEIKNPLTPIQLSAERIRRRYLGNMKDMEAEVLDRATHTIVQQVEAMRDMVNAFSEYARAPEITLSPFDLNQLIREVAYLYRAEEPGVGLRLDLDEQLGTIRADAIRVRQLLHNLIRNALEALDGRPGGWVEVASRRAEVAGRRGAEIMVSDNGPGIESDTLEQVFEPYVTTKSKGTGLGLAIVKRLVEEHGGSVGAENLPEGGARIRVRLPLAEARGTDSNNKRPDHRRERA